MPQKLVQYAELLGQIMLWIRQREPEPCCHDSLFEGKEFESGNAAEVSYITREERQFMDLAHGGDKCVLDADIHAFAGQSEMERGGFPCARIIEGDHGHAFEESVDKAGLPALLDAVHQFIHGYGSYLKAIFKIGVFEKLRAGLMFFQVVDNHVRVYNELRGFHVFHFLSSSLRGVSKSTSLSAPSRVRKLSFPFVMTSVPLLTRTFTASPSSTPIFSRKFSGTAMQSFFAVLTVNMLCSI